MLFNKVLRTGSYPREWNLGYVSTIFKAGKRDNPDNYRCITIISCLGKLFGTVLNNRLQIFLEKYEIIKDVQIGFKKKSRTVDHMFVLKAILDKYKCLKKKLFLCFVDFSKAYDSVWRHGLLFKLLNYEIGGNFYECIKHMYSNTSCAIKEKQMCSDQVETFKGVRQGDPLSPTLFNIYTNDIPDIFLEEECQPITLYERKLSVLQYADDIVIMSETVEGMKKCLHNLEEYCGKWLLDVNVSKTKIMCTMSNKTGDPIFTINNKVVEIVHEYKYLGCIIDDKGSFRKGMKLLYDKARRAIFALKRYTANNNLNAKILLDLFDKMIEPVLLYASEIWTGEIYKNVRKNIYDKFEGELLHRSFVKYTLKVHKKASTIAIMSETGRYPVILNAIKQVIKYQERISSMGSNTLLSEALQTCQEIKCKKTGWVHEFEKLNDLFKVDEYLYSNAQLAKEIMKINYRSNINKDIMESNKLRTFKLFKNELKYEPYLNIVKNETDRSNLTRFRISAHDLNIERGRYNKKDIINRKCRFCEEIEDEQHIFSCPKYENYRNALYEKITCQVPNFDDLDTKSKFIFLMSSEDNITKDVAKFITNVFNIRKGE
jgi:hypothetical protein